MADTLEDIDFTSIYGRVISRRARERLEKLGEVENPTRPQKRGIAREESRKGRSQLLVKFAGEASPFRGIDEEAYIDFREYWELPVLEFGPVPESRACGRSAKVAEVSRLCASEREPRGKMPQALNDAFRSPEAESFKNQDLVVWVSSESILRICALNWLKMAFYSSFNGHLIDSSGAFAMIRSCFDPSSLFIESHRQSRRL